MQDCVKERSLRTKEGTQFTDTGGKSVAARSSLNSFSDDEDTREMLLGARSTDVRRKSSGFTRPSKHTVDVPKQGASKRGRGRGTSSMKQTTLSFSQSRSSTVIRSEEVASSSEEEADANEVVENSEEESAQQVGRKRAAPRCRGRGRGSTAKRGRKTDIASIQSMMSKDDDSEDEPPKKAPPRVTRNYGAVRRR
ncbi:unnamed protein product [Urochloa humidicola]